jgi:hypothetical protein
MFYISLLSVKRVGPIATLDDTGWLTATDMPE